MYKYYKRVSRVYRTDGKTVQLFSSYDRGWYKSSISPKRLIEATSTEPISSLELWLRFKVKKHADRCE